MPLDHYCTCERYCHGGKPVSRATYNRHSDYRHQLSTSLPDAMEDSGEESEGTDIAGDDGHDYDHPVQKKPRLDHDLHYDQSGRLSPAESDSDSIDPGSLADDDLALAEESDSESDSDSEDDALNDDGAAAPVTAIADLQNALDFIEAVKNASLDNGDLDEETLSRLRNPLTEPLDISDPAMRFSLDLYLAATHGSEKAYTANRDAYLRRHP
ncbi:hypothetical protein C8R44DRAFT_647108, partial [Mycena epipterygia]